MTSIQQRIDMRLEATGKSARQASLDAGLSPDTIGKILNNPQMSQTLLTIEKLAAGLATTPHWIAYGIGAADAADAARDAFGAALRNPEVVVVDRRLLREALLLVLLKEGVDATEAEETARIFPEALEGPAVDAVDRDPLRSFQVHLQLRAGQARAGKAGGPRRQ